MARGEAFEKLSDRQKLIVANYFESNCNKTEALRRSGMGQGLTQGYLRVQASATFADPNVKAAIAEWMEDDIGSGLESLRRMTAWSRCTMDDVVNERGEFDIEKARANGSIHAVKSITTREFYDKGKKLNVVETRVELHDAKDAEKTLMKHRGMLADIIALRDLPKDKESLVKLLTGELERAGVTVQPGKGAN